jgi:hypothetical protein
MNDEDDSKLIQAERVSSGKHILKFLVQVSSIKLKMIIIMNIMIQVMVSERKNHIRMSGMMPRNKNDLDRITNTITENYVQLKENKFKSKSYIR